MPRRITRRESIEMAENIRTNAEKIRDDAVIEETMRLFPADMEPLYHTNHCYGCDCVMLALANHIRDLESQLASERELRREAGARAENVPPDLPDGIDMDSVRRFTHMEKGACDVQIGR